jgi:hypothetical protein
LQCGIGTADYISSDKAVMLHHLPKQLSDSCHTISVMLVLIMLRYLVLCRILLGSTSLQIDRVLVRVCNSVTL